MEKGQFLYEGKAKQIFATDNPEQVLLYFKDDATAFNAQKKGSIKEKGVYNNLISTEIFKLLEKEGISTHFIENISDREMLVKKSEIIPIEVVVRNIVAGSLSKRLGIEEGVKLKRPIVEFYYKDDALGDPMINDEHALVFGWASEEEIEVLKTLAFKVNDFLIPYFKNLGIDLVDYKLEFGRHKDGIVLCDEITPDGCRLWDSKTQEKLDKDRFRRDLGNIEEAYERVYKAVCA